MANDVCSTTRDESVLLAQSAQRHHKGASERNELLQNRYNRFAFNLYNHFYLVSSLHLFLCLSAVLIIKIQNFKSLSLFPNAPRHCDAFSLMFLASLASLRLSSLSIVVSLLKKGKQTKNRFAIEDM